MTEQLKQEILSTLTPDCFPCKITDVEEFVKGVMANVSTEFFLWAVELAQQAEDDDQLDFVYKDVYELFPLTFDEGNSKFVYKNVKPYIK